MAFAVLGCRDEHELRFSEITRNKGRIDELSRSNGHIEAFLYEIDKTIGTHHLDGHVRMTNQVLGDDRSERAGRHGSRDPQHAARRPTHSRHCALGLLDVAHGRRDTFEEQTARLGEAQFTRRALDKPLTDPFLKVRDLPAHRGLRQVQTSRCFTQAPRLNDPYENQELVEIGRSIHGTMLPKYHGLCNEMTEPIVHVKRR